MKCLNIHIIKGTVGRDARINKVGERAVANFSVATEFEYKTKDGWEKEVTWHEVAAWQGYGICELELLTKGTKVLVVGRERKRKYTDQSGTEKEVVELLAETVDILAPDKPAGKPQNVQGNNRGHYDEDSF